MYYTLTCFNIFLKYDRFKKFNRVKCTLSFHKQREAATIKKTIST